MDTTKRKEINNLHNTEKEMKAIREFIEFAKSTIQKGIGIEQDFEDFSVGYDGMHAYRARHGG